MSNAANQNGSGLEQQVINTYSIYISSTAVYLVPFPIPRDSFPSLPSHGGSHADFAVYHMSDNFREQFHPL